MTCAEAIDTTQRTLGEWMDKRGMPTTLACVLMAALGGLLWWNLSGASQERIANEQARQGREEVQRERVEKLEAKVDKMNDWVMTTTASVAEIQVTTRKALEESTAESRLTREAVSVLTQEIRARRE